MSLCVKYKSKMATKVLIIPNIVYTKEIAVLNFTIFLIQNLHFKNIFEVILYVCGYLVPIVQAA